MHRSTAVVGAYVAALVGLIVICITVLVAMGKDPAALTTFLIAAVPTVIAALWSGNRASTAAQSAGKAEELAGQAVHNTNGRFKELTDAYLRLEEKIGGQNHPIGLDPALTQRDIMSQTENPTRE